MRLYCTAAKSCMLLYRSKELQLQGHGCYISLAQPLPAMQGPGQTRNAAQDHQAAQ